MAESSKTREIDALRKRIKWHKTTGRARCKGDPEALKDNSESIEDLERQIRDLGGRP